MSSDRASALYVHEKRSIPQIATELNLPRSRVRQMLLASGVVLRSRGDGVRLRRDVLGAHAKGKAREITPEWRANIARAKREWGALHAVGVSHKGDGYIEHTTGPHKGRSVHVVKMEQRLGRHLLPDECVHHIDGNRANNDDNNLALVTRSGHTRLHKREQRLSKRTVE
jgi:hypothetical protein